MKYINKQKLFEAAEQSSLRLGVQRLIFKDNSFIDIAVSFPESLLEDEHGLEVIYLGEVIYTDDELTDVALEKADLFIYNYINIIVRDQPVKITFD